MSHNTTNQEFTVPSSAQINPKASQKYADIINLPRPVSTTRPHLSTAQRAAQFAPYKTITAYHDSTDELEANSEVTELEIVADDTQLENFDIFYADTPPEDLDDIFDDDSII